jgi:hypothetical protein
MAVHSGLTPSEAADRLAIRELFDAHARLRRPESVRGNHPLQRAEHRHDRRDSATGDSYTIAHHVFTGQGARQIVIASLRYLDTFTRIDQGSYFAERNLLLDWSGTRSI